MNRADVAASSASELTVHTLVQYLMPYYTCTVYRAYKVHYACISVDSASSGPQNRQFNYRMRSVTLHKGLHFFF
jgi:hypothetical protein